MEQRRTRPGFDRQGDVALFGLVAERGRGQVDQLTRVHVLTMKRQFARISQGEHAQVFHQTLQTLGLVVHDLETLWVGFGQPVAQRDQVTHHHRQWRAQLVGDIGRHLAAQDIGAGQAGVHRVERRRHLADLVLAAYRYLLLQIAARYGLDRGRDLA